MELRFSSSDTIMEGPTVPEKKSFSPESLHGPPAALTGEGIKLSCIFEAVREIYRNIFGLASFEILDRFRSEIQLVGHPVRGLNCQVIYSQFGLAIHQNDHQARRRFVECAQNEISVVPDFHKRILFSDEAYIWLTGCVNKQNCRIWSEANPQVYVETPLHPETLTVLCAIWAGGIIGSYFFKNDEGHNVTVNCDRYRAMIITFFIPELNNHEVQELWFQQDGTTCHTARATIDLLKDTFVNHLISNLDL
ncbi:transposase [Trichonephila clavipes]|nr:transposase [Trichonephila clavipes]